MKDILQGEQRQAYNFGVKIGQIYPDARNLLAKAVDMLKSMNETEQNSEFIAGLLSGINDNVLTQKIIDDFIDFKAVQRHSFYLTNTSKPALGDILKLLKLVDVYQYPISYFSNFQYGSALSHLTVEDVITLCKRIASYDKRGGWTALSLFYMYSYNDDTKFKVGKPFLKSLLSSFNFPIVNDLDQRLEGYHWSDAVCKILVDGNEPDFAEVISHQIIEFCEQPHFNYGYDTYIKSIIAILFQHYPTIIWPQIQRGLISDYTTYFHLKHLIGFENNDTYGGIGILFNSIKSETDFLQWIQDNLPLSATRISVLMPLEDAKDGNWHSLTKQIIDRFGNSDEFLQGLASNMGTYGIIGSSVPYFERQKRLLEQLKSHPIQRVKKWATEMLRYTEKQVEFEKMSDEQRDIEL